ncbi:MULTISPECIES: 3'-5' exonuclease [Aerococcus]|uniref:DNA 3'-5' helicase n=2 Tax=Aerococcus TaxID=1375 RepID=A0A5N1GPM8_9LACT|nr:MULTISPECIES: ATP-dependent helicase [Aerococcus]KAA9302209.1 ATP-dependent helicase [Aerococcus sanguinicola]MDK6368362.1 ATP-dependent helicase [Aerococcus sp. UMB9870]MDK6679444.1 ATP-dependent helicase [Aerococcus sp. UMB8608]MDK6941092.1 ATP-dependent helicase [Aerococcus sp. UMB8487]OFR34780.1 hypothetical protein HMPREF2892_04575 [Aerococcus sp. HMSC061A03]
MSKKPTEEQKFAIQSTENMVLTAVPGSGKTFTLVEKIKFIKEEKSDNDFKGIIGISYTNKASDNLKKKVYKSTNIDEYDFFGTIDSFYLQEIIYPFSKHYFEEIREFQILHVHDIFKKSIDRKLELDEILDYFNKNIIFIEQIGDLAFYLLETVPQIKKYIAAKYSHIMIDEYQDCGKYQHQIFCYLVKELNLCGFVVGDLNQSIFKDSKYLKLLIHDTAFTHHELTLNFRSNEGIIEYSNCLKSQNYNPKKVSEKSVSYIYTKSDNFSSSPIDIAKKLPKSIEYIKSKYNIQAENQIAIFARTHDACQVIAKHLNIPYKYYSPFKLLKKNDPALRQFHEFLIDYFKYKNNEITSLEIKSKYFSKIININYHIKQEIEKNIDYLLNAKLSDYHDEIDKFKRIFELIEIKITDENFKFFIKEIISDRSELKNYCPAKSNEIQIMTMHNCKGLEFDIVFIFDMYRFIIPYIYDGPNDKDNYQKLNKDFNLFYVAVTRAKKRCFIMIPEKRINAKGEIKNCQPSPFLSENNCQRLANLKSWYFY